MDLIRIIRHKNSFLQIKKSSDGQLPSRRLINFVNHLGSAPQNATVHSLFNYGPTPTLNKQGRVSASFPFRPGQVLIHLTGPTDKGRNLFIDF
jgi:hypothetical protein